MNNKTLSSLFVLFAIVSMGITAAPSAFAEHSMNATVENADGSSVPGCEPDCFIPATVTIGVGGQVTFANNDNAAHTSTSGIMSDDSTVGVAWDSGLAMPGTTYTTPALEEGEYPYFCMVHPWMVGMVIVEAEKESHDDHGHDDMKEDHGDMGDHGETEVHTLTAADIVIDIADGAKADEKVAIGVTINGKHVNYDIVATQNGETILDESDVHSHTGSESHITSALSADASDDSPILVEVTFQGFGMPGEEMTGPVGLTSNAQAVPEFGTIAALILVVAIGSIIAVSAKSRLSFMPKI